MNEYKAIIAFHPALMLTKKRFWPPRPGQITRLLIISFFIGAWLTGPVPQDISFADLLYVPSLSGEEPVVFGTDIITTVLTGFVVILLVYALFSAIFQFIFIDFLSSETNRILPSMKARIGMGLRLLGFYISTVLIIGLCSVIAIFSIAIPVLQSDSDNPVILFIALSYTLIGLLILIIPVWILTIITTDFVVPVMMVHACGIITGWKILLKAFSGKWDETGVYLLIKITINIITGIILGILLTGILEMLGFSSLSLLPGIQPLPAASVLDTIIPFCIMGVITLVVMTPVVTFLRYYGLQYLKLMSETDSLLPQVFLTQA